MREPIENEYFNWLCAKVLEGRTQNYDDLLKILYSTEFIWIVPSDQHRAEEGIELRQDFLRETGSMRDIFWEEEPCSIFELFLGFANRASFQTDIPVRDWFWTFMTNLNLDQYRRVGRSDISVIEHILHVFMWRIYDPSGHGGMFPMSSSQNDQRELEIWYQWCEWVDEKGLI